MTDWKTIDSAPECKDGESRYVIVAVERSHRPGRASVFAAYYLQRYPLVPYDQDRCLIGLDMDECESLHEEGCPVTGWYENEHYEGDPDGAFKKLLRAGDKLLGWRRLPKWDAPPESPPPNDLRIWRKCGINRGSPESVKAPHSISVSLGI